MQKPEHQRIPSHRWWACEYPERPVNWSETLFKVGCKACFVKLEMGLVTSGDRGVKLRAPNGRIVRRSTLKKVVEQYGGGTLAGE